MYLLFCFSGYSCPVIWRPWILTMSDTQPKKVKVSSDSGSLVYSHIVYRSWRIFFRLYNAFCFYYRKLLDPSRCLTCKAFITRWGEFCLCVGYFCHHCAAIFWPVVIIDTVVFFWHIQSVTIVIHLKKVTPIIFPPNRLFMPRSKIQDYLSHLGRKVLASFPVQATLHFYNDDSSSEEEDEDEDETKIEFTVPVKSTTQREDAWCVDYSWWYLTVIWVLYSSC